MSLSSILRRGKNLAPHALNLAEDDAHSDRNHTKTHQKLSSLIPLCDYLIVASRQEIEVAFYHVCSQRNLHSPMRDRAGRYDGNGSFCAGLSREYQRYGSRSIRCGGADATAVATAIATGVSYTTTASTAGEFKFQDLPLGEYNVVVEYQRVCIGEDRKGPQVSAGTTYTLHVKINVAGPGTHHRGCQCSTPGAGDRRVDSGDTLPNAAVQNTPNNGRDFTLLVGITTGSPGNKFRWRWGLFKQR